VGLIFARLLVGWLEANATWDRPDLIVANPTYANPAHPRVGHIEAIIAAAAIQDFDRRWPFDTAAPAAIIKTQLTPQSAGQTAAAKRVAADALRRALVIPDPSRTAGRHILIFDDVCTTGYQLNTVADCLLTEGRASRSARWFWLERRGDKSDWPILIPCIPTLAADRLGTASP
jgi:predicted amidophosphoribosyltransferase